MLRRSCTYLRLPGKERPVSAAPLITRTRTWRGQMQVVRDEGSVTAKEFWVYGMLFAPIRVGVCLALAFGSAYALLGHDEFMFQLMGYESEMQYEAIVNPTQDDLSLHARYDTKASFSPVRALERPLHPTPVFDQHLKKEEA